MSIRPCAFRGNNPGFPEEYLRQPSLRPDLDATEPASPVSAFPTLATRKRPPNSSVNHNRSGREEWAPAHLQARRRIAGGERESASGRERCRRRRRSSGGLAERASSPWRRLVPYIDQESASLQTKGKRRPNV